MWQKQICKFAIFENCLLPCILKENTMSMETIKHSSDKQLFQDPRKITDEDDYKELYKENGENSV